MRRRLSMQNLLAALIISASAGFGASIGVTSIRQAGAPLDTSTRNEAEHAVDVAAAWLAAHQSADGSWGAESGRVTRTAVALVALTSRWGRHSDACVRAAVWLDGHSPATNELSDARAWRAIALLGATPDAPGRSNLTARLLHESLPFAPATNACLVSRLLWSEALAPAPRPPAPGQPPGGERLLGDLAAGWPPPAASQPDSLWPAAYLINRLADGVLSRGGQPLDWRRDLAQILLNSQRRDPAGGGFWGGPTQDDRVRQTAFGILALGGL